VFRNLSYIFLYLVVRLLIYTYYRIIIPWHFSITYTNIYQIYTSYIIIYIYILVYISRLHYIAKKVWTTKPENDSNNVAIFNNSLSISI
jgi:hypothetical protein